VSLRDLLPAPKADDSPAFRYGTVTALSPLRVQLDGDATPVASSPVSLEVVGVGDRVLVMIYHRRMTIVGVVGGVAPPAIVTDITSSFTKPSGSYCIDWEARLVGDVVILNLSYQGGMYLGPWTPHTLLNKPAPLDPLLEVLDPTTFGNSSYAIGANADEDIYIVCSDYETHSGGTYRAALTWMIAT